MLPLLLTPGDPRGVGPEISVAALRAPGEAHRGPVVLLGDVAAIRRLAPEVSLIGLEGLSRIGTGLRMLELPEALPGAPGAGEPVEARAIRVAVDLCLRGLARGIVTGPIHKARLHARGFLYSGHTDFLGALCGVEEPIMAFAGEDVRGRPLRVSLVTVHVPLSAVPGLIRRERVLRTIRISHAALRDQLRIAAPRITVCGLNPHAGEEGVLGHEEIGEIAPACAAARAEGIDVRGPVSAETAFIESDQSDLIVAMYHDQALVPLKAIGFGRCVNWTLGLPILRTSVDHGTADALVGTGRARADSMLAALRLAEQLSPPATPAPG